MKRHLFIVGLVALALVLSSSYALAGDNNSIKIRLPQGKVGDMYDRSKIKIGSDLASPVGMPVVVPQAGPGLDLSATAVAGPSLSLDVRGGMTAIYSPRGSSMLTPRDRSERENRRLMRHLE